MPDTTRHTARSRASWSSRFFPKLKRVQGQTRNRCAADGAGCRSCRDSSLNHKTKDSPLANRCRTLRVRANVRQAQAWRDYRCVSIVRDAISSSPRRRGPMRWSPTSHGFPRRRGPCIRELPTMDSRLRGNDGFSMIYVDFWCSWRISAPDSRLRLGGSRNIPDSSAPSRGRRQGVGSTQGRWGRNRLAIFPHPKSRCDFDLSQRER